MRNPLLPSFLDEVILRNLSVGEARVDIAVHRRGSDVSLQVLQKQGDVEVSIVYSE